MFVYRGAHRDGVPVLPDGWDPNDQDGTHEAEDVWEQEEEEEVDEGFLEELTDPQLKKALSSLLRSAQPTTTAAAATDNVPESAGHASLSQ